MSENIKFVGKNKDSKFLESIIEQKNEGYKKDFSSSFHPSTITECPRRLVYRTKEYTTGNKNEYLDKMDVTFRIMKWIEFFRKMKSIQVLSSDFIAADCHYNISGKIDAILKINGNNYVTKIYPINSLNYAKIGQNGAFKKHVIEIMIYMWITETTGGILLYENKDNNEYLIFNVDLYIPIINSVKKKCLNLIDCKIDNRLPNCPYKDKKSAECLICEFNKKCLEEKL